MKKSSITIAFLFALLLTYRIGFAQPSIVAAQPDAVVTDIVTIVTSKGTIVVGLYGIDAPKTVANFVGLAEKGFYNGILFHRVAEGFVIQAGDPATKDSTLRAKWGRGGTSIYGGKFEDELNKDTPSYQKGYAQGVLAMANSGPNTNLSQFFFCLDDLSDLDKNYTMFGKVLKGMDVVSLIGKVPTQNSVPIEPVSIISTKAEKP